MLRNHAEGEALAYTSRMIVGPTVNQGVRGGASILRLSSVRHGRRLR